MTTIFDILGRKPIHPFPARMAPLIALDALGKNGTPLRVLDPMVGSGTVVAVAQASGHEALGFDTDPLAVLVARVWTTPIHLEVISEKARARRRNSALRSTRPTASGVSWPTAYSPTRS